MLTHHKWPNLRSAYSLYNRKYFNNLLPLSDTIIKWASVWPYLGDYGDNEIRIERRIRTWTRTWKLTLLHEMAHQKIGDREKAAHGKLFKAEMRRLARIGALDNLI